MNRLRRLEQRLQKDSALSKAYEDCMNEYISLGHITLSSKKSTYLLPHLAVIKESSTTTKCRVVFDCSAVDDKNLSLNDRLYRGPPLLQDISLLLMNFRFYKISLVDDIRMMYRMISVHPADRHNLVVAWRSDQYLMTRLPFGLKPSGFIAGRCVLELANLYQEEFPEAARAIRNNRYADDFCTGAETIEEAKQLRSQLSQLLQKGGFEIRRWSSNVPEVLSDIDEEFKENLLQLPTGDTGVKVLGILWDQSHDAFVAKVIKFEAQVISKRNILSYIAKFYDIMGFFSPTIFLAKYFMQRLWMLKISWDQPLPEELANEWRNYANGLASLSAIKISRVLPSTACTLRLVGFSDASEKGMAAVVYLQWSSEKCIGGSKLLKAKTKLAPLKTLTIPSLELCAALMLTKLIKPIVETLEIKFDSVSLYTDSQIVLTWLDYPLHELKVFVSNRVSQMNQVIPPENWGQGKSSENPADLGSRGMSAEKRHWDSEVLVAGPRISQKAVFGMASKTQTYSQPRANTRT